MELKIAICASQPNFDEVAKLLLAGWKVANKVKTNGITSTDNAVVYHLIKYDPATEAEQAKQFIEEDGAKTVVPQVPSGIQDVEEMQFFDTEAVPAQVKAGWKPLSKDHVFAKGAWLIKCKTPQVQTQ